MNYEFIIVEKIGDKVGKITLNRPKVYNALCNALLLELSQALREFDEDDEINAIVLTGGDKVFAAGADIKELSEYDFSKAYNEEFITKEWAGIENHKKPIIAAVSGFALGGGCEMSLMCDIVICDNSAKFGQPEVKIGTIPGAGGTQRLTRAVGKSKAMQMCLTGDFIDAKEAKECGIVSEICENGEAIQRAEEVAKKIAANSRVVVNLIKESINNAYEMPLSSGLKSERKSFYATLTLEDRLEGMKAFIEKRKPDFKNK